ncbi:hypothetical protein ACFYY8_39310 [Streptosporangium sp. NPDC001559]
MARLKPWEVGDELWAVIEPLSPEHQWRPAGQGESGWMTAWPRS